MQCNNIILLCREQSEVGFIYCGIGIDFVFECKLVDFYLSAQRGHVCTNEGETRLNRVRWWWIKLNLIDKFHELNVIFFLISSASSHRFTNMKWDLIHTLCCFIKSHIKYTFFFITQLSTCKHNIDSQTMPTDRSNRLHLFQYP